MCDALQRPQEHVLHDVLGVGIAARMARQPSEVPPMFLVTRVASSQSAAAAHRIGADILGTRKDVTIADIVAATGVRRPDSASAPETFRQAFLYLVAGTPKTSGDLQKLEGIRSAWEGFFSDSTDRHGTIISRLR